MKATLKIAVLILLLVVGFLKPASIQAQEPVVQAVLFYSPTCAYCKIVIEDVLPGLDARYGSQLQIYAVDTSTEIGNLLFENFLLSYEIPPEDQVVPALLVGDQALFGSQEIPEILPQIVDQGLSSGGIPWPDLPDLQEAMAGTLQIENGTSETASYTEKATLWQKFSGDLAGNILAVIVLLGMIGALIFAGYNLINEVVADKDFPSWIIPLLSLLGIGVAAYLTYVEYNQVEAVCGPVGNCNAVQQSSFATIFGVLPVGVVGLLGYLGIILVWLLGLLDLAGLKNTFAIILWGFTLLGTLYSIYLTFLEPFVIGATCIWCLSSAVIMTLLFLVASRKLTISQQT